jgi:IMP dehydrogenase/GMP reductase
MLKLLEHSKFAKNYFGDGLKLMVGNIANPETFRKFCEIGVDYVRCSVGSGAGCLTATELGILYPMASLIDECHRIRKELNSNTKIVADGGISSFRRMFKSLALGADYVMLGSTLNKLEDSAGEIIKKVEPTLKGPVTVKYKEYYGMASEKGMKMLGKTGTPEGKVIFNKCNGTIASFTNEFINLFKSLMSYCNIKSVETFIGVPELNILSDNASEQFNQSR